jgi:IclR family acetate operon transcriptional repressor
MNAEGAEGEIASSPEETEGSTGSSPLRRITRIISEMARRPDGLALREIAGRCAIPVSTAHRLMRNLQDVGYAEMDPRAKLWRPGPRLRHVADWMSGGLRVDQVATPLLGVLAEEVNAAAFMCRFTGREVVLECFAAARSGKGSFIHPGSEFPFHATSAGKLLLSYQPREFIEAAIPPDPVRYGDGTVVDRERILDTIAEARRRGYAIHDEELDTGVWALSAVVPSEGTAREFSVGLVGVKAALLARHDIGFLLDRARACAAAIGSELDL